MLSWVDPHGWTVQGFGRLYFDLTDVIQGAIMKRHMSGKIILAALLVSTLMCLLVQPVLAGDKPKNKDTNTAAATVKNGGKSHEEIDRILANGPPTDLKSPPGFYIKTRGNTAGMIKYFKNGHPDNNSEWVYCPGGVCPYVQ